VNLEDLGNVGDFVAAIATIVTLIYLAIQIRQNTAAVRSSTHQQQVDTTVAMHTNVSNDPALAKLITKANSDFSSLDESQQLQLLYFYTNYFNMWHFQYTNMRKWLFDEDVWNVWNEGWVELLQSQMGMCEAWSLMGGIYGGEFEAHINKLIISLGLEANSTGALKKLVPGRGT